MRTHSFPRALGILLTLAMLTLQGCTGVTTSQLPPVEQQQPAAQASDAVEPAAQETPADQELTKLKVIVQPFITFAPYHIAEVEGYYAEQGLDVELVTFNTTEQILPALSSGQADVASGLVTAALFNAVARGGQFRITADKGYVAPEGCSNWALLARKDVAPEITTAGDLKGWTINVVPASWLEYYLDTLMASGNLARADIERVNLTSAAHMDALSKGTVDLVLNSEPSLTRLKQAGNVQVLTPPEQLLPNSTGAVMMYGPSLLGENSDAGMRFMVAYLKAVRQLMEGPTERNIELIGEFTQLDPALLKEMCWPSLRSDGDVNVEDLLAFQEWAKSAGHLAETVPAEKFWDGRFVEYANQALGSTE